MKNLPQKAEHQVTEEKSSSTLAGSWDEILAQVAPVEDKTMEDQYQQAADPVQVDKAKDRLRGIRFQTQGE